MERALDDVRRYAQETMLADGRRLVDEPWVQHNLAWVHARLDVLRLMNWQVAWHAENGDNLDPAAASAVKVFGTEFYMEGLQKLLEILGPVASVRDGSPDAVLLGRLVAPAPRPARADLRWRHQRAAARPHRHLRPGPPRLAPLTDLTR